MQLHDVAIAVAAMALTIIGFHFYITYRIGRRGLTWEQVRLLIDVFHASRKWESQHHKRLRLPRYTRAPSEHKHSELLHFINQILNVFVRGQHPRT
jgi:hypothetical protein